LQGFKTILFGAFLLEAAGYLAFPYIGLELRDSFGMSESKIGLAFLVAISLRPLWAILGGLLAERGYSRLIFTVACLCESICFFSLGIATRPIIAIFAIVLGNIGLSFWTPNLYALVYRNYAGNQATAKTSLLTGALSAGAAAGCLGGALLVSANAHYVFLGAGILYLAVIFPIVMALGKNGPDAKTYGDISGTGWREYVGQELVALILVTAGFWASYAQFNSFFSLYAKDWLGRAAFTGVAFGILTTAVAIFSTLISRISSIETYLKYYVFASGLLLILAWQWACFSPTLISATSLVLVLAGAESVYSIWLADRWAKIGNDRPSLFQSFNFSGRNIAMGIGSFAGGLAYKNPQSGLPLFTWGLENAAFIAAGLGGIYWGLLHEKNSSILRGSVS
jgi:predicted MFS family arabinose efflux permease